MSKKSKMSGKMSRKAKGNYTLTDEDKGTIFIYEMLTPVGRPHEYLGKYVGIQNDEYVFESFEQGIKFVTSVGVNDEAFLLSRLRAVSRGGTRKYKSKSQKN